MIKIGVLGCGKIAERHLRAYKKMPMVDVVIADIDRAQADRLGEELKVPVAEDLEMLFTAESLDALDLCIPTRFHKDAVLKSLGNGKHVFCEKPLCLSVEEALEIERAASAAGRIVMVGHLYRFHPAFQFVKEVLEEGIIGRPYFALFRLGGRGSHTLWKHRKDEGGGAILEMLVHMLDLILWYFGDVETVTCLWQDVVLKHREINGLVHEVDAEDLVLLKLKTGGVEVLCESDLLTPSYMNTLEIHGENGSIFTSILHFLPTVVYCKKPKGVLNQGNNFYTFPQENLFEKELRHFVEAIKNGGGHLNSVADSIKIFRVLEQVRRPLPEPH